MDNLTEEEKKSVIKDSYINSITYYCYNNWYFTITKKT